MTSAFSCTRTVSTKHYGDVKRPTFAPVRKHAIICISASYITRQSTKPHTLRTTRNETRTRLMNTAMGPPCARERDSW